MPDKDPKNDNSDPKKEPAPEGGKPTPAAEPIVYDSWIGDQPEEVVTMLDGHTAGLKSALEAERTSSKQFEKELRVMAEKAEGDVKLALETKADEIGKAVDAADRKTNFYETAHAAGVTNLKLAYHVAVTDEMFDRLGNVNFDTMKTGFPELFGGKSNGTKGSAGEGKNNSNVETFDMNKYIRQKAGRS